MAKNQGPLINNAKAFIVTYASTFGGMITLGKITNFLETYMNTRFKKWYGIVAKEEPDEEIHREHFHGLFWLPDSEKKKFNVHSHSLDIRIPDIVSVQIGQDNKGEPAFEYIPYIPGESAGELQWRIVQCFGKQCPWKILNRAHPNLKKFHYGKLETMFDYVIKQNKAFWCTDTLEELKMIVKQDKTFKQQRKSSKRPDWAAMKEKGMTFDEAIEFLKENFPNQFMDNWHKWEPAALKFFDIKEEEEEIDWDAEYWLPNELINWFDVYVRPFTEHVHDKEWQKRNRNKRPKSLIWIGKSKRGKTTVAKAFMGNYYHHMMDGYRSFKPNAPVTVIDDFHWDFNKYFTNWRCWLGAQTKFTVNPKYGRRKKIDWGHPCVVLHNKSILEYEGKNCSFDEEDFEYINENCVVINTGSQYLWEKPGGNCIEMLKYRKIKLSYFKPTWLETKKDEENLTSILQEIEEEDELPPIEEVWKRVLEEVDNGRPEKKRKRAHSI